MHRFDSLRLGNFIEGKPLIAVLPDVRAAFQLQLDMMIGMDFLRQHRVWVSFQGYAVHLAR
jgi:hypothetical protein